MRSPRPGSPGRARTRGCPISTRWRERTPRCSGCRGTAARRSAPARASGPRRCARRRGMIRTYNAVQRVQVFGELSTIDYGDAHTVPGYVEDTLERIEAFVQPIAAAGVVPVGMGGDHTVTLAELRAIASVHGQLGLLHFDSHTDLWDSYNGRPYSHGTMFRRAIEEGILDPARTLQVGMRGPLYGADDENIPAELGVETVPWVELAEWRPDQLATRARERLGDGPAFLTFDVDFVDPAYCPGTGTPEVGGPTSFEALKLLRACTDLPVRRLRRGGGRPDLRRPRADHRPVRGQRDLRDVVAREPHGRAPHEHRHAPHRRGASSRASATSRSSSGRCRSGRTSPSASRSSRRSSGCTRSSRWPRSPPGRRGCGRCSSCSRVSCWWRACSPSSPRSSRSPAASTSGAAA